MNLIVSSILLIGASAKPSTSGINANALSASKISIAGGLRGPHDAVAANNGMKRRALFLDDLLGDGGHFEELFACGETCTDDSVCTSLMMTFDPTSVYEEACNAGCFPELQLSTCEHYCNGDGASEGQTIVDIAMGNADFSTLVAAITAAGLADVISGEGPFTVFAPTNEAFAALPEETLVSLLLPENIEQLQDILKYHAVAGLAPSSSLKSGDIETLSGDSITITAVSGSGIMVNDAFVLTADIMASNGIIHVIDKVLLPPADDGQAAVDAPATALTAVGRTRFFDTTSVVDIMCGQCRFYTCCVGSDEAPNPTKYDTCKGYWEDAQAASELALEDMVGSINDAVSDLFAPGDDGTGTDGASSGFDELFDFLGLGDLLEDTNGGATGHNITDDSLPESTCHFCASGLDDPAFVLTDAADGATCLDAQNFASTFAEGDEMCVAAKLVEPFCCSGSIETITTGDGVIDEPGDAVTAPGPAPVTDESTETTIDLLAATFDDLSTLVAAITAAGLMDVLSKEGPFTIFAPTNEAFAALPEETVESLLLPENIEQLQDILKYHAVAGLYPSSSLTSGAIETLSGDSITITAVSGSGIMVNDAEVITADIMATNGIIHVIDKVLLPPNDVVTEGPATGIVEESADVDTPLTTEASAGADILESQGNTGEAISDESPESSTDPAEDTISAVSVDTTMSAASSENSGSSALSISVYAMASIAALFFVSS